MTLQTIPEITFELDRLASEIARINAKPFEDRIDLRIKRQDLSNILAAAKTSPVRAKASISV